MKKQLIGYGLIILVIILVIVFGLKKNSSVNEKITIGWFGPLSGPVASVGEQNLRGIQLAIEDYGKDMIDLHIEDDQFTTKNSFSAYEKLKTEKVFMMMSPTYNGLIALAPKADADKIFIANSLDASSEVAKAGEYLLGIGYYTDGHGINFAKKIEEFGAKRAAVLYNQGTLPQVIVNSFKEQYKGNIVLFEGYKPETTDFRSTISKMKSLNVDTVLLIGWDESGLFVRQSTELNYIPTVFGWASFTSPGFISNAGKTNIPMHYLDWDKESKEYNQIVQKYEKKYGEKISQPLLVALGYDSMTFIIKTLEKGKTQDEFGKNIYKTVLDGLTGQLKLDKDGITRGITNQNKLFKI